MECVRKEILSIIWERMWWINNLDVLFFDTSFDYSTDGNSTSLWSNICSAILLTGKTNRIERQERERERERRERERKRRLSDMIRLILIF